MRRTILIGLVAAVAFAAAPGAGADDYSSLLYGPQCKPHHRASKSAPFWARGRRMTVLVDSVLLGGLPALREAKPCWRVYGRGEPALMIRIANARLRAAEPRVARVAVIGLGYNSLWERHRAHFKMWAEKFDHEAKSLLRTLEKLGARRFVWVTLREPTAKTVPPSAVDELGQYSWYFPYVNARLRRLDRKRDDLILADWAKASRRNGLTYDTIHLNPTGAKLMAKTIRRAIFEEAKRSKAEQR